MLEKKRVRLDDTELPYSVPLVPDSNSSSEENEQEENEQIEHLSGSDKGTSENLEKIEADEIKKPATLEVTPAPLDFDEFPPSNRGSYVLAAIAAAAALLLYFGLRTPEHSAVAENVTDAKMIEGIKEKTSEVTASPKTVEHHKNAALENDVASATAQSGHELINGDAVAKKPAPVGEPREVEIKNIAKEEVMGSVVQKKNDETSEEIRPVTVEKKKETHVDILAKAKNLRKTNKAESLKEVNRALDKKKTVSGQLFKAELLMSMGKNRDALLILLPMTQKNIGKSKGWYLRGNAHKKLGQRSQAQQAYAKCLMLSPSGSFAAKAKKALASL